MTNSRPHRRGATDPAAAASRPAAGTPAPAPDPRRWKALGVLAAGLALIVIDGSIVAVSLPTIITDLSLDLPSAQWVTTSYAVVLSALLLISGRLGDRVGRRRLLLVGVAIFLVASVLAALASGAGTLIAARLLQGVGGALILPSTLSSVNATFRGRERAAAFGVWGAVMAGAAALGPLLGGWLTSSFSWPWIFLVNLPVGLAVLLGTLWWVAESREETGARGVDVLGAVLSALALGSLVVGIVEATTLGWWQERAPLMLGGAELHGPAGLSLSPFFLLAGVILLGAFVLWQRHRATSGRAVLLDLDLFRLPAFAWGNLTAGTVAIGEFGLLFVLPLYLVDVRALGTLEAGLVLAAMAGGAFLSGMLARHLAAAIGAPGTVLVGLGMEVLGVGTLSVVLRPTTPVLVIVGILVVYGLGLGLASAQLTSTVLAPVPAGQSGQGSATQSTVRQLGTALGTAVAGAMLAAGLTARLDTLSGQATQFGQTLTDSAGSILPRLRAQQAPSGTLDQLSTVFTEGTRIAMAGSAGFLLLGLVGAIVVSRAARVAPAPRSS
ncbi:MAG: DHA2 family efflux MFS transporter permease subunit [Brachybacterium sp.]|uniref:DHA2 family efflux MFS transporter permease subunit n=1 Tax=Brachybacterium sp. TaxID=1891286 RepID=UPI0026489808|nr:DHA2 family efflux MFS transporter permease subunit [Brachybacterium sp.]MDN5686696.1 DHA2 family efflux MFS transporter permease subunit [Brachybacterium sp.]